MPANISRAFRSILILLYAIFFALIIYYLVDGWSYYSAPLTDRPRLDAHINLKPGGIRGHGLGMIGTFMMLLLLLYSLRKRFSVFRNLGAISRWLDLHIFMGIMGPLLIILHSSFKLNGIVSISFWSMIAVALSGVLGRYIYAQIPRGIRGNELGLQEVEGIDQQLSETLIKRFKLDDYQIKRLQSLSMKRVSEKRSLLRILLTILTQDMFYFLQRPFQRYRIKKIVRLSGKELKHVQDLAHQKVVLKRRLELWQRIHHIFHNWHIIHKPFAVIMYLIMVVHVALTIMLGYRWLF